MTALLLAYPGLFVGITAIVGLLVGSFLNVVVYRLPLMMQREWTQQCSELLDINTAALPQAEFTHFNLARPGSHCPQCRHPIGAMENIPVLSYLLQGGKCRHCQAGIPLRYPAIEFVTALLSALIAWQFGFSLLSLAALLFCWCLIVLSMIDFDHQLLPDDITLPLLWIGLLLNYFGFFTSLESALLGAVFGYGILWSIYWLFRLLTGKEGMGYGDFKLLAALGAWLGWEALPAIILISSLLGAVVGISLILLKGRDRNVPIPFGPYLAAAGFATLVWGPQLSSLYVRLFGV